MKYLQDVIISSVGCLAVFAASTLILLGTTARDSGTTLSDQRSVIPMNPGTFQEAKNSARAHR